MITIDELKELWYRDKAYLLDKPSIDRIDNDGNYTFENCRYIELSKNSIKGNKETHTKTVYQFNLNGKFIKEWNSITKASKFYNLNIVSISQCLHGKSKTSGGFIWSFYKNIDVNIHKNNCKKEILQYDLEGIFYKEMG